MEDKQIEKNDKTEFKLPKESIRPLGQQYQLSSNRLSSYLGLPSGGLAGEGSSMRRLRRFSTRCFIPLILPLLR